MKLLVTGGAGFIGSNFIHYMLEKYPSYKIICLDLLTYASNMNALKPLLSNDNFKFIKGDISHRDFIISLFKEEKFDSVINFAAETHVDRSIVDSTPFIRSNIVGTQVLLDASKEYQVKRFHQVSTDEVYGELPLEDKELKFTEKSPLNPSSPYSASKASSDLMCLAYFKTYNLPITISRCSNNYGPYQFHEKLIPKMITNALHNKKCPIYGTGENVRDWLHVLDHVRALDLIIHDQNSGEVYNIGGNCEKSNLEVVSTILELVNKDRNLLEFVADRLGHDKRYAIDFTKLNKDLGWIPLVRFETGIKETIIWYIKHRNLWITYPQASM